MDLAAQRSCKSPAAAPMARIRVSFCNQAVGVGRRGAGEAQEGLDICGRAVLVADRLHRRQGLHAGACRGPVVLESSGSQPRNSGFAPDRSVSCIDITSSSLLG